MDILRLRGASITRSKARCTVKMFNIVKRSDDFITESLLRLFCGDDSDYCSSLGTFFRSDFVDFFSLSLSLSPHFLLSSVYFFWPNFSHLFFDWNLCMKSLLFFFHLPLSIWKFTLTPLNFSFNTIRFSRTNFFLSFILIHSLLSFLFSFCDHYILYFMSLLHV